MKTPFALAALLVVTSTVAAQTQTSSEAYNNYQAAIDAFNRNQTDSGNVDTLIVGGTEVPAGTRQYTTGLRTTRSGKTFCGGALIAPQWVLTAAHCTVGDIAYVAVGGRAVRGTKDATIAQVVRAIPHPQYVDASQGHDFLLLNLDQAIPYAPVALAKRGGLSEPVGTIATTMGWGLTQENGAQSNVLLGVEVALLDNDVCAQNLTTTIPETMICAGGQANKDSCQNDSGGPLVVRNADGSDTLVGVVSWGIGCGRLNFPGVYARVSAVRDFIDQYVPSARWL